MSRKAKILTLGMVACALAALGVAWFYRANSMTAKEAAIHNIKQIDEAMRQASTNTASVATYRTAPRP